MGKLQIRKKSELIWEHIDVDAGTTTILSNFTFRMYDDIMEITELNGVDNFRFPVADIEVYDDTSTGIVETFASAELLATRLKNLNYPPFLLDTIINIDGVTSIVAGTNVTVDASDPNNPIVSASGGGGGGQVDTVVGGTDITVDSSDPANPIVNYTGSGGSGTVTSVAVSGSDGIEIDSGSPITTSGTIALGLNRATLVSFLSLLESEVKGIAIEDATFTGTENLDLSTFAFADITLQGNTTITVTNTPSVNNSFVRNLTIRSTATETLTLPVSWVVIGEYVADGSDNYFSILFNNLTTAGASVICYISQEA